MKKNTPYGRQQIDASDVKEVVRVLKSDWLTQGPKVKEFEKAVARYCKVKYAVAVCNGTAALYLAYKVAGLNKGNEIITTPLTFAATSNMLCFCGAEPVFVDIEKDTLNIDPEKIEEKINKNTKAIITVDFAGNPCDYKKILKIAKKHKLLLIEDACHALGAEYKNKKIGSFADMTILSFHPVKHITTGEGGMILTNNKNFYEKLKILRSHGIVKKPKNGKWYYEIKEPSFNFRITDFQCALGLSQLKKIKGFLKRRREIAKIYRKELQNIKGVILPKEEKFSKPSWHLYPVQFKNKNRKKLFNFLQENGIGVQVHYMPLHLHPFYKNKFGYKKGDFPVAEEYYKRAITLPLFPKMTTSEINKVIKLIKIYYGKEIS